MARTPTTADVFNAVAEASRRDLLDALGDGEATVSELVDRLRLSQPQVSKHLAVLRAVGLVSVRVDGRHHRYRVEGLALKPVHDWVRAFERTWNARLDRPGAVLAELTTPENQPCPPGTPSGTATAAPSSRSRRTPRSSSPATSTPRPRSSSGPLRPPTS